ncbi:FAD-dependent oxidoreductase [Paenibacillus sp. GCM10023250]|uniref:FAD-dependent oxidoreductase n=1 Tax=Paenibacillus sp. GCM10023250 TaxID=3252648 RepID=UPI00361BA8DA
MVGKFEALFYYSKQRQTASSQNPQRIEADLCIYGGTPAGIAAGIQGTRMGLRVVIAEFGVHLGGMTASGLGRTDIGNKDAIGGISREFYRALGQHYGSSEPDGSAWAFEPHVAERIYAEWVEREGIPVYYGQHLASVARRDGRIAELTMENGNTFQAGMFIDATYEGDLLAMAGVSYHVGREANSVYRETLNGIHFGHPKHNFYAWVDPYRVEGKPDSGLLPGVSDAEPGYQGQGDRSVQAYNFRICLTNVPGNRIPFPQPPNYDPDRFALLARYLRTGVWDTLGLNVMMPRGKTDLNNRGGFSTDHIGANHRWPEASYEERERIYQDHVNYDLGLLYFLANDDRVPAPIRGEVRGWGLPADEFVDTNGWPHQLYVREGRRMISDIVMTEHHCRHYVKVEDSVGLAAYTMDSHNCRRIVLDGRCVNEGNVEISPTGPYPVSYRAIVPKTEECTNLLVPVCLSASHIAYGSIRMEPVFMILGQSAATAAAMALEKGCAVQEVDYKALRLRLELDGQRL